MVIFPKSIVLLEVMVSFPPSEILFKSIEPLLTVSAPDVVRLLLPEIFPVYQFPADESELVVRLNVPIDWLLVPIFASVKLSLPALRVRL